MAGAIGLHPFAVDDELRDGALAGAFHHFLGRAGSRFDIDFFELDVVLGQEALGFAAVGTPEGGIDGDFHVANEI